MKKKIAIAVIVIAAFALICMGVFMGLPAFAENFDWGVRSLDIANNMDGSFSVSLSYASAQGYSVTPVGGNDVFCEGEIACKLSEHLPENIVKITLSDCDVSEQFKSRYDACKVYERKLWGGYVQYMWAYSDHGMDLYVASDRPIYAEKIPYTSFEGLGEIGTLNVRIGFDE